MFCYKPNIFCMILHYLLELVSLSEILHFDTNLGQAVTKCGTVAPPVRGTAYFARHNMVNMKNKKGIFLLQERRVPLFELQMYIYIAKVYLYGACDIL